MKRLFRNGLMAFVFVVATFTPFVNASAAEMGHNNIWKSGNGEVAVLYENRDPEEQPRLDGETWGSGEVVDYELGDEITIKARADSGYYFIGWYVSDVERGPDYYHGDQLVSTSANYTYRPGVTTVSGIAEPINYVTAVFAAQKPRRTVITEFIARPYDTEEVPYDTVLAKYTASKLWPGVSDSSASYDEWVALFGNVDGVWQYPAPTGLTWSFVEREETETEIINKYTVTYDQMIVTKAAEPVDPSDDEQETDVTPSSDDSKDAASADSAQADAVKTGDSAHPWIFVGIALAALICMILVVMISRRRRTDR